MMPPPTSPSRSAVSNRASTLRWRSALGLGALRALLPAYHQRRLPRAEPRQPSRRMRPRRRPDAAPRRLRPRRHTRGPADRRHRRPALFDRLQSHPPPEPPVHLSNDPLGPRPGHHPDRSSDALSGLRSVSGRRQGTSRTAPVDLERFGAGARRTIPRSGVRAGPRSDRARAPRARSSRRPSSGSRSRAAARPRPRRAGPRRRSMRGRAGRTSRGRRRSGRRARVPVIAMATGTMRTSVRLRTA